MKRVLYLILAIFTFSTLFSCRESALVHTSQTESATTSTSHIKTDDESVIRNNSESVYEIIPRPEEYEPPSYAVKTFGYDEITECEITYQDESYTAYNYSFRKIEDASVIATDIIIGTVVDVQFDDTTSSFIPFTVYSVDVSLSLRGRYEVGDIALVVENGGYKRTADGAVFVNHWGHIPTLEIGDEMLLFLYESALGPDVLVPVGYFSGKYYIENGEVWRYTNEDNTYSWGTLEDAIDVISKTDFNLEKYKEIYRNRDAVYD